VYLMGEALHYVSNVPSLTRIVSLCLISTFVPSGGTDNDQKPLILTTVTFHRFNRIRVNPLCLNWS